MKASERKLETKTTEELVADLLILDVNNEEKISEKEQKELIYHLITHIQTNPKSKEDLEVEGKSPSYLFFAEQYEAAKLADSENVLNQINFIKALYNPDVAEITTIENSILPDWKSQKMESIKGEAADLALKEKKQTGARIDGIVSYYDNAGAIHKDRDNRVMIGQDFYSKNSLSGSSSDKEIKLALEKTYLKIAFEAAIDSRIFSEDDNRILTELVQKGDFYAEKGTTEKNSEAKPLVINLAEILSVIKEHDVNDDDEASGLFSTFDKFYQQKTKAAGLYSGRAKGFTFPIKISNKSDGKTVTSTVEYKLIDDQGNIMSEPTDANGLGSKKLCSFDQMMEGKGDRAAATEDDIKAARKLIENYIPEFGNRATYFSSELIARMKLERTEVPSQAPDIEVPEEVEVPERLPVIEIQLVHRRKSFTEDVEETFRTEARSSAASSLLEKIRARKNRPSVGAEPHKAKAEEVVAGDRADARTLRAGAAAGIFVSRSAAELRGRLAASEEDVAEGGSSRPGAAGGRGRRDGAGEEPRRGSEQSAAGSPGGGDGAGGGRRGSDASAAGSPEGGGKGKSPLSEDVAGRPGGSKFTVEKMAEIVTSKEIEVSLYDSGHLRAGGPEGRGEAGGLRSPSPAGRDVGEISVAIAGGRNSSRNATAANSRESGAVLGNFREEARSAIKKDGDGKPSQNIKTSGYKKFQEGNYTGAATSFQKGFLNLFGRKKGGGRN